MKGITEITTAVDRIEGEIIVCSDDGTSRERYLSKKDFPHLAVCDVLRLTLNGDTLLSLEVLSEETERRKKELSGRLMALFNRTKKS